MAKVPMGRGENDSEGASPTDEQPPGEGMEGMGRDLHAVNTCCAYAAIVRVHVLPLQLTLLQQGQKPASLRIHQFSH